MEKHHFLWVNQLFLWPFSIAMLVITRGYLSETPVSSSHIIAPAPSGCTRSGRSRSLPPPPASPVPTHRHRPWRCWINPAVSRKYGTVR